LELSPNDISELLPENLQFCNDKKLFFLKIVSRGTSQINNGQARFSNIAFNSWAPSVERIRIQIQLVM
jgi:hypothetical protein